mgnify:CR=1 FL=1
MEIILRRQFEERVVDFGKFVLQSHGAFAEFFCFRVWVEPAHDTLQRHEEAPFSRSKHGEDAEPVSAPRVREDIVDYRHLRWHLVGEGKEVEIEQEGGERAALVFFCTIHF